MKHDRGWTEEPTPKQKREWANLRSRVLRRDRFRCQRCILRFVKADLQAHHVIPRNKGGTDNLDNLLALCNPCHDWVEIQDPPLLSKAAIEGSFHTLQWGEPEEVPDWYVGFTGPEIEGWDAWERDREARYWARIKRIAALSPQEAT